MPIFLQYFSAINFHLALHLQAMVRFLNWFESHRKLSSPECVKWKLASRPNAQNSTHIAMTTTFLILAHMFARSSIVAIVFVSAAQASFIDTQQFWPNTRNERQNKIKIARSLHRRSASFSEWNVQIPQISVSLSVEKLHIKSWALDWDICELIFSSEKCLQ